MKLKDPKQYEQWPPSITETSIHNYSWVSATT